MIRKTNGFLESYYEKYLSGELPMCREMVATLEMLMQDMDSDEYVYDTTKADSYIHIMEHLFRQTKEPFFNAPLILLDWEKAWISAMYGFLMRNSEVDRFRRCLLTISRKSGKSLICASLGLATMLIGGKGLDIVCSSNNDAQASILYDEINTMRMLIDPKNEFTWKNQQHIRCTEFNNKVFKISDTTKNKEGRNVTIGLIDEANELQHGDIVKAIEQSQSTKPNPKLIILTSEGFLEDGVLERELAYARSILFEGYEDNATKRFLPWIYTQDSEDEVWDGNRENKLWLKSNPSLGTVKKWEYLEQQISNAQKSKEDRAYVLTKDFNIHQNTATAWLLSEDYSYDLPFDPEEFRGAIAVSGTDIAETTDLCSNTVILRRPNDPTKYIMQMYWIPQTKLTEKFDDSSAGARYRDWQKDGLIRVDDANYVDTTLMADWFAELYRKYGIRLYKAGYDVKFSHDWEQRMEEYGFSTEIVYQRPEVLSTPIKMIEKDFKSQHIAGVNPVLRWCLGNASLKLDAKGYGMLVKAGGTDSRRIDGAVSLVIAYEMYRRYMTDIEGTL